MSIESKLQALLTASNNTTGETDTTLTDAVQSLIDGFGGGGGLPDWIEEMDVQTWTPADDTDTMSITASTSENPTMWIMFNNIQGQHANNSDWRFFVYEIFCYSPKNASQNWPLGGIKMITYQNYGGYISSAFLANGGTISGKTISAQIGSNINGSKFKHGVTYTFIALVTKW